MGVYSNDGSNDVRFEFTDEPFSADGDISVSGANPTAIVFDGPNMFCAFAEAIGPGVPWILDEATIGFVGGGSLVPPLAGETQLPPDP